MPKSSIDSRTPSALQPQQRFPEIVRIVHEDALGDLQTELAGSTPLRASASATMSTIPGETIWRTETLTATVIEGSVSCHCANRSHACPRTQAPMGTISPDSSASGMKSSGLTKPRSGCSQRINASALSSAPVLEVDNGLVVHDEFGAIQCAAQSRRAGHPLLGPGPQHLVEQLDPIAAAGLGQVHCGGGVPQQALRRRALVGDGDPDAGGGGRLRCAAEERHAHGLEDSLGDVHRSPASRRRHRR